ncbi:hypothetical protein ACIPSA_09470 [Streptomyces sp. NPDC086549]|uniref:hypothetical protein n=1 Tax=Streptomyces sp. NPDC086549 TaxID=3365752 RepID=UPI003822EC8F
MTKADHLGLPKGELLNFRKAISSQSVWASPPAPRSSCVRRARAVCVGPNGHTFNLEGNWVSTRKDETSHATCRSDPAHTSVGVLSTKIETGEPIRSAEVRLIGRDQALFAPAT